MVQGILVGGGGQDGPLDDSWLLDFKGGRWLPYPCMCQTPRAWHAACVAVSREVIALHLHSDLSV